MSGESTRVTEPRETATEFIARKNAQWADDRERGKTIRMKDAGRWVREAWTFRQHSNNSAAILAIEKLHRIAIDGEPTNPDLPVGIVEYRLGYYIIGKNGRAADRWVWGQFAPMMPGADLDALLKKARKDGTLPPS